MTRQSPVYDVILSLRSLQLSLQVKTNMISIDTLKCSPDKMPAISVDDIFKYIFANEIFFILIHISLKFVPKGPINNNPSLIRKMACCLLGAKPLSEPMMIYLLMYICITRPQWVNPLCAEYFLGFRNKCVFVFYINYWYWNVTGCRDSFLGLRY